MLAAAINQNQRLSAPACLVKIPVFCSSFIPALLFTLLLGWNHATAAVYYSTGNNNFQTLSNWKSNRNGTGVSPANFYTHNDTFVIQGAGGAATAPHALYLNPGSTLTLGAVAYSVTLIIETGAMLTVGGAGLGFSSLSRFQLDSAASYVNNNTGLFENLFRGTENFHVASNFVMENNHGNAPLATAMTGSFGNLVYKSGSLLQFGGTFPNIAGNLILQGTGEFRISSMGGTSTPLNIDGDLSLYSGKLNFSAGPTPQSINLKGDFIFTGGILETAATGGTNTSRKTSHFNFCGTSRQRFARTGGSITALASAYRILSFNVLAGATLDIDTSVIDNTAGSDVRFNLQDNATLITANTDTAGALSLASPNGSIQTSGSRWFSSAASYIFSGSAAQVAGSGLPSTVKSLGIHSTASLTLSAGVLVTGQLSLQAGVIILNHHHLQLAATADIEQASSASYVVTNGTGFLRQYIDAAAGPVSYPVAPSDTAYNPVLISNGGGVSDYYGVRVVAGAPVHPTNANAAVQVTWIIADSVNGGSNLVVYPSYAASDAGADFQPDNAYVAAYISDFVGFSKYPATIAAGTLMQAQHLSGSFQQISTLGTHFIVASFPSASAPGVVTGTAQNISTSQAIVQAMVNPHSDLTTATFSYGVDTSYPNSIAAAQSPVYGSVNMPVDALIAGLTPNTLYHYRVVAQNTSGTTYGSDSIFITQPLPPHSLQVDSITTTSCKINLTPPSQAGNQQYTFQIQLCTDSNYSNIHTFITNIQHTQLTTTINTLTASTTYYLRVRTLNQTSPSAWTNHSIPVITPGTDMPTVQTLPATNITHNSATLNATITNPGSAPVTHTGFAYNTAPMPLTSHHTIDATTPTSTFSATPNTLLPNTTYYVRAYANNSYGTAYANQVQFNSLCTQPTITSAITAANIQAYTVNIKIPSPGNGQKRIIIARPNYPPLFPIDAHAYSANSTFASGQNLGDSSFVVFNDDTVSAAGITITNLRPSTKYYFSCFDYNNGLPETENYFTDSVYTIQITTSPQSSPRDHFRSKESGSWHTSTTWQSSRDSIYWFDATTFPDSSSNSINIRPVDSVIITINVLVDELNVSAYAKLTIAAGAALVISNGAGTDLNIKGKLINSGALVTMNSAMIVVTDSTASYEHKQNNLSVSPSIVWNTGSTLILSGEYTGTSLYLTDGAYQNIMFIGSIKAASDYLYVAGNNATIAGTLIINATGDGTVIVPNYNTGQLTVNNYVQTGGNVAISRSGASSRNLNVLGDATISGGMLFIKMVTASGTCNLNVAGNLTIEAGGQVLNTATQGLAAINLNSKLKQVFTNSGSLSANVNINIAATSTADLRGEFILSNNSLSISAPGARLLSNSSIILQNTSTILVNSGHTFTMSGQLVNSSTLPFNFSGAIAIDSAATYIHHTPTPPTNLLSYLTLHKHSTFIYRGSATNPPIPAFTTKPYGNLTLQSTSPATSVLVTGTTPATIRGNLHIGENISFTNALSAPLSIGGNLTINGNYTDGPGTQTITFNGTSTITAADTLVIDNFNLNTTTNVTSNTHLKINGNLNLQNGMLNAGDSSLTIAGTLSANNGKLNAAAAKLLFVGGHSYNLKAGTIDASINLLHMNLPDSSQLLFDSTVTIGKKLLLQGGRLATKAGGMIELSAGATVDMRGGVLEAPASFGDTATVVINLPDSGCVAKLPKPVNGSIGSLLLNRGTITLDGDIVIKKLVTGPMSRINAGNYSLMTDTGITKLYGVLSTHHEQGVGGSIGGSVVELASGSKVEFGRVADSQQVDDLRFYDLSLVGGKKVFKGKRCIVEGNLWALAKAVEFADTMCFEGDDVQVIRVDSAALKTVSFGGVGQKRLESEVSVWGRVLFGSGGAVVDFDGAGDNYGLRLKSGYNRGGSIGDVGSFDVKGRVRIERYAGERLGGDTMNRRAFRFMSHPFEGSASLSMLSSTIDITGVGGAANGFTPTAQNNPSAFRYDNGSGAWVAFTNTNGVGVNAWKKGEGIRLLIRGKKGQGLSTLNYKALPVTMEMSGVINKGNVAIKLLRGADGFNLVGNPYPSAVQLQGVLNAEADSNLAGAGYWVWHPYDAAQGRYKAVLYGESYMLPIGGAFFVEVKDSTILSFTEADKADEDSTVNLLKSAGAEGIKILLEKDNRVWDDVFVLNKKGASDSAGKGDGRKLMNPDADIYTLSADGVKLSIDNRCLNGGSVVRLGLRTVVSGSYKLSFAKFDTGDTLKGYLHDMFTGTVVAVDEGVEYWFVVNSSAASQGDNRFKLVFAANGVLPLEEIFVKAYDRGSEVVLEWQQGTLEGIRGYWVERLSKNVFKDEAWVPAGDGNGGRYVWVDSHAEMGTNVYRLKVVKEDGSFWYSRVVSCKLENEQWKVAVSPNPVKQRVVNISLAKVPSGKYLVRLLNAVGVEVWSEWLEHVGGSKDFRIELGKVSAGVYQLQVGGEQLLTGVRLVVL